MKKVLLLSGWMRSLKLYKTDSDLNIRIGKLDEESVQADYVVGISLGALAVLQDISRIKGKIILINPPLPKRTMLTWFINWLRFITTEGLFFERQKFTRNPMRFISALLDCIKLLGIDFSEVLDRIPKERILVIRGRNDKFFCDDKATGFIVSKGIKLIEVDGEHNWSEAVEKTMREHVAK